MAQTRRTQDAALREVSAELKAFADYSRWVAQDAVGPTRLTWKERAEWADRLAGVIVGPQDEPAGKQHWRCPRCGTLDGPMSQGRCDICEDECNAWVSVVHYETHPCNACGLPYYERMGTYWLADDALWARVVGDDSIVLCPACFRRFADAAGVSFYWRAVEDREPGA
jgi:ribosomal protein L37E